MNNTGVIQTTKSADLITFKILTDGEELSKKYQVKSIVVSKEVNRIPTAQIVLIDGEAARRDFSLSNETLLIPGKEIEITAGYHSDEETIFKGIIIKHNLRIRKNSQAKITATRAFTREKMSTFQVTSSARNMDKMSTTKNTL